jgi:hypothetical protein
MDPRQRGRAIMKLYEFLSLTLESQGEVLGEIYEGLGPDSVSLFENFGMEPHPTLLPKTLPALIRLTQSSSESPFDPNVFDRLEHSVQNSRLSERLQDVLWTYPYYRAWIESSVPLTQSLGADSGISTEALIEDCVNSGETWALMLPVPEHYRAATDAIARHAWVRFRARALKRLGFDRLRPL